MTLGGEGLDLWLGKDYAQQSTRVLQWLAIGVFINSLARLPFALIQGIGRPDLTAKLHMIELPFYLLLFWIMIGAYGIEGVAIAWSIRIMVDTIILFGMSLFLLPKSVLIIQCMTLVFVIALLALGCAMLPMGINIKAIFLMMILPAFALATWFLILSADERNAVVNWPRTRGIFR